MCIKERRFTASLLKKTNYDKYLILPNNIPHYTPDNIVHALFRSI